jgi:hypothetical protein
MRTIDATLISGVNRHHIDLVNCGAVLSWIASRGITEQSEQKT